MGLSSNELRIGNLVKKSGSNKSYIITLERFWKHYNTADAFYYLEPIPLTEEILLKCGFVKEQNQNGRNRFELGLYIVYLETEHSQPSFHFKAMPDFFPELTEIHYLHQLQNLYYSLTGQELNIEL